MDFFEAKLAEVETRPNCHATPDLEDELDDSDRVEDFSTGREDSSEEEDEESITVISS